MTVEEIMKVLPHRYPFLLLDRVIEYEPGKRAVAIKNVSMNEPFFQGHFPDRPIMPGVLQLEALAQVGGIVMLQQPISDGTGDFFFGGVDRVKWRRPVLPGDTLVLEMTLENYKPRFGIAKMAGKYVALIYLCPLKILGAIYDSNLEIVLTVLTLSFPLLTYMQSLRGWSARCRRHVYLSDDRREKVNFQALNPGMLE